MKVYQLKILDLGLYLDPVFKTKESAEYYRSKYNNRNIIIKEKYLDNLNDNYIYRIKNESHDGYYLEDEVYSSMNNALEHIKDNSQTIIKESLYV